MVLLRKPAGLTSFEALGAIKRALGTGKVGHTGTLDKFAQGLLVALSGRALKLSPWFSRCDKRYHGTIRFGVETDTLDPEGDPVAEGAPPSREAVEAVLPQFTGSIMQAPPVYSAIHVNGKRASALARAGEAPEMKLRPVHIYRLELRSWDPPFAEIFVHCSGGTYIRSLARDIAGAAGSRAHLAALLRTGIAGFELEEAVDMEAVALGQGSAGADFSASPPWLRPVDKRALNALGIPCFEIGPEAAGQITQGKPLGSIIGGEGTIPASPPADSPAGKNLPQPAGIFHGDDFIAMIEWTGGKWRYNYVYGRA
jgi:tRNA pseudouridine55 synthase